MSGWPRMLPPRHPAQETADRISNHLTMDADPDLGAQVLTPEEVAAARLVIAALERMAARVVDVAGQDPAS